MTPENHTLFDWNTLDEFSDLQRLQRLQRLQMVFDSLPAEGLLDARRGKMESFNSIEEFIDDLNAQN